MKKRKLWAVAVAGIMTVSMFAGCGKSGGNNDNASSGGEGSKESTSEESGYITTYGDKKFDNVTISVELFDRSNAPEGSTLTKNRWVDYINEEMGKVGINIDFVAVPRSDEITKMQTMMSSQTAPDLTLTYNYSMVKDYYNKGGIWDLAPFVDGKNQAKNIKSYITEPVMDIGRLPEGVLTGIVARRATTANSNLFLRKDWLDEVGGKVPTTPDELFNTVKAIKEKHPESISYFFSLNAAENATCYRNNLALPFFKDADNEKEMMIAKGIDYYYNEGAREYFRYANKWYHEGLLHPEYYAMTTDSFNSDVVTGKTAFFEMNVNYSVDILRGSLLKTLQENDPNADLISIPNLLNVNDNKQYSANYSPGGLIAFCPKTASEEKVEAAVTYLDWQCTKEGGHVLYHGFEGEHYDLKDGVEIVKDAQYNAKDKDWLRTDIFLVGNQGYFATVDQFNACTAAENPGYEEYVIDNYENAMTGKIVPDSFFTAQSQIDKSADFQLLTSDWIVKCVTGPEEDFDKTYDEFMKAAKDLGIQQVIDERTEFFDELYK